MSVEVTEAMARAGAIEVMKAGLAQINPDIAGMHPDIFRVKARLIAQSAWILYDEIKIYRTANKTYTGRVPRETKPTEKTIHLR